MKQKLSSLLALVLLAGSFSGGTAQASSTAGEASDFFNIGAGARAMAMGGAFTGLADDASAPYYNPAGLANLDEHQLLLMHAPLFFDTSYEYLSSVHPFGDRWGTLGISDALEMTRNIDIRDEFNAKTGNGTFSHNAIFTSYAHKIFQQFSVGGNVKFIQKKMLGTSGSDYGLDAGLMWKPYRFLNVGAAFMNVNAPAIKLDTTPDIYRPVSKLGLAATIVPGKLVLTTDVSRISRESNLFAAGAEFSPSKYLTLRGGYNDNKSYTFGVGINIKTFRIDYALSDTDLGAFNKVSVTWAWHNIYKTGIEPPMKEGRAVYPLSGFENKVVFHSDVPEQTVSHWELILKDAEGKDVRTLSEHLRPPKEIVWDAKNAVGEPVVDGKYFYTFIVHYKNGKSWTLNGDLKLDLPDQKIGQGTNMNLELNGAKAAEQTAQPVVQQVTTPDDAKKLEDIKKPGDTSTK